MELMAAIEGRRAVRSYTGDVIDRPTLMALVRAAVEAPSATNAQPWAFVVVQGADRLKEYSAEAKAHLLETSEPSSPLMRYRAMLADPKVDIFHGAGILIVICARPLGLNAAEDCCLAAQNLMLAAHGRGLGTCPIGFARPWLNRPDVKGRLGIPADYTPVFPVVVGIPREHPSSPGRREPQIVFSS